MRRKSRTGRKRPSRPGSICWRRTGGFGSTGEPRITAGCRFRRTGRSWRSFRRSSSLKSMTRQSGWWGRKPYPIPATLPESCGSGGRRSRKVLRPLRSRRSWSTGMTRLPRKAPGAWPRLSGGRPGFCSWRRPRSRPGTTGSGSALGCRERTGSWCRSSGF